MKPSDDFQYKNLNSQNWYFVLKPNLEILGLKGTLSDSTNNNSRNLLIVEYFKVLFDILQYECRFACSMRPFYTYLAYIANQSHDIKNA